LVVPQQSVLTNVWLGTDGLIRRRITPEQRRRRAWAGLHPFAVNVRMGIGAGIMAKMVNFEI